MKKSRMSSKSKMKSSVKAVSSKKSSKIKLRAPLPMGMSPLTPPQDMLPSMPSRDENGAQDLQDLHAMAGGMAANQMGNEDPQE